jgi:hypothetical protein
VLLAASGIWQLGLGAYFILIRPPLLPEDLRFMGTTQAEVAVAVPGLARWLGLVFMVMGGFMASSGVLTLHMALATMPKRAAGTALAFSMALGVGLMSGVNFALRSDFRWLLSIPVLVGLSGLAFYAARR